MSQLPTRAPAITVETEPFWTGVAEGRLLLPRCDDCATVIWYPRRWCPTCHRASVSWFEASGRGIVYSYTVVRRAAGRWGEAAPFVIAYVELDEGPRVLTNVVDCDPEQVTIGQPVTVTFDRADDGQGLFRFRPA